MKTSGYRVVSMVSVVVVGALLSLVAIDGLEGSRQAEVRPQPQEVPHDYAGPYRSLEALVDESDVILMGSIDTVAGSGEFAGYTDPVTGTLIPAVTSAPSLGLATPSPVPDIAIPYVDFELAVTDTLKDDGLSNDWIVRQIANGAASWSSACPGGSSDEGGFHSGTVGESFIFFLNRNPDSTYGLSRGGYTRINTHETTVTYSDCLSSTIDFASTMSPSEFIEAVETEVAN